MASRYVHVAFLIGFICISQFPTIISAQQLDPNGMPYEAEEQITGCPRLEALPPLASSKVVSCQKSDSVEVTMPLKPDAHGYAQEKKVRGAYEFREYRIGKMAQPYAFDNLLNSLPMSGFTVKYSNQPSTITARKGDTWILINVGEDLYNVSVVEAGPESWTSVKTVEEISREIATHNRVDIYGVQFSPSDQSILEAKSQILLEILKYLKQNSTLSIIIESDKVSPTGAPEDDAEITRQRANAVMDWLIAHGIARSRLQPWPAGRNNPITANESPEEIQRNERIVLRKQQT
jgi:outer membrane protein OmpA-like peptidoglycan-associated protein